jgi:hypothetical protein
MDHNDPYHQNIPDRDYLSDLTKLHNHDLVARHDKLWDLIKVSPHELENHRKCNKILTIAKLLCALFPNELFIAGGFIVYCNNLRVEDTIGPIPDIDMFICAYSEQRAIHIIRSCIQKLEEFKLDDPLIHSIGTRSDGAFTYYHSFISGKDILNEEWFMKIQFIHRLYAHPSQIIGMFDVGPCQIMYSHSSGYQATRMGDYCMKHKVQFLDPTRRSTSYDIRVRKYVTRGYRLVVPNIQPPEVKIPISYTYAFYPEAVGFVGLKSRFYYYSSQESKWVQKPHYNDCDYQERGCELQDYSKALYFTVPLTRNMPLIVELKSEDWLVDVHTTSSIERKNYDLYPDIKMVTINILKEMYSGDELKDVIQEVILEEDHAKAIAAWKIRGRALANKRLEELRKHFKPYNEGGFFRIANPGQQGGGSNNPSVMTGSEFWDPKLHLPIQVGITNEIYFLLKNIWMANTTNCIAPKDIFQLICRYVVVAMSN